VEHAHQLIRRAGRIGQRPENIEDGPHAEFAAHRRDVLHCRVMVRREHEAHAGFRNRGRHLFRLQIDIDAERFEHVRAAGFARHAAIAVLRDFRAGGGGDEHRRRGNVEGVRPVAAGADDIDEVRVVLHVDVPGKFTHHRGGRGDLADGLFFDA
jgi:hypothetical protein